MSREETGRTPNMSVGLSVGHQGRRGRNEGCVVVNISQFPPNSPSSTHPSSIFLSPSLATRKKTESGDCNLGPAVTLFLFSFFFPVFLSVFPSIPSSTLASLPHPAKHNGHDSSVLSHAVQRCLGCPVAPLLTLCSTDTSPPFCAANTVLCGAAVLHAVVYTARGPLPPYDSRVDDVPGRSQGT